MIGATAMRIEAAIEPADREVVKSGHGRIGRPPVGEGIVELITRDPARGEATEHQCNGAACSVIRHQHLEATQRQASAGARDGVKGKRTNLAARAR